MLADAERPLVVARRDGRGRRLRHGSVPMPSASARSSPTRPTVAAALVGEALRRLPSARRLSLNLPRRQPRRAPTGWRQLGAEMEPWDGRMARGPQVPRREDTIYGNAVGALG